MNFNDAMGLNMSRNDSFRRPPVGARRMVRHLAATFGVLLGLGCTERNPDAQRLVNEGAVLLDVRTAGEYANGHLRGAMNIPVQSLESRLGDFDVETPVVVYCQSGGRSAAAARMLRARGVEVHDLGSMTSWGSPEDIVR